MECEVQFNAVVTIAPRHDVANIDSDIPEAMVTCICQVGLDQGNWQKGILQDASYWGQFLVFISNSIVFLIDLFQ